MIVMFFSHHLATTIRLETAAANERSEGQIMSGAKFKNSDPVDFLVIGAGAAGGVMAKELATAGFRVVVLEQGPYLTEKDYRHDEIRYTYLPGLTNDPKTQPTTFRETDQAPTKLIKAIEYGASSKAVIIGKPSPRMFKLALQRAGAKPSRAVMVGDQVETDMLGASKAGVHTVLVLSGVETRSTVRRSKLKPELIVDRVDDLERYL